MYGWLDKGLVLMDQAFKFYDQSKPGMNVKLWVTLV